MEVFFQIPTMGLRFMTPARQLVVSPHRH